MKKDLGVNQKLRHKEKMTKTTKTNTGKKVVLVYTGGLDTSICIPLMKEQYGYDEVITVTVDVGQPKEDILQAEEKAKIMGTTHFTVDAKDEFAQQFCCFCHKKKIHQGG
jgi:argininosuccinate synthase